MPAESHADLSLSDSTDSASADSTDLRGATRFLDGVDHRAYGSLTTQLRNTLTLVSTPDRQTVWVSPVISCHNLF